MKKLISVLLIFSIALLIYGIHGSYKVDCFNGGSSVGAKEIILTQSNKKEIDNDSFNKAQYEQDFQDLIQAELDNKLSSDDYKVESIVTSYISDDQIELGEYNFRKNIYFGYTEAELNNIWQGKPYIFTCDEKGNTTTKAYEKYDDTFDEVVKNVSIGTGAILVCVTLSIATAPTAVSGIFAFAAEKGTKVALSSSIISGVVAAITTGYETKDVDKTFNATIRDASEGYKWGAILGAIEGGTNEYLNILNCSREATSSIPTFRESEVEAVNRFGGKEQVSFLGGEEVSPCTKGATRPDIVRKLRNGNLEAIEVKNYNLHNKQCRNQLYGELRRQVGERTKNLPKGSKQRIVLDVRGRGYSKALIDQTKKQIKKSVEGEYHNIPINIMK
jgi:hypothetical protein